MYRSIRVALAAVAVLALASLADAATLRISFKKGSTSATVSGRLRSTNSSNSYLLKVGAGQNIKISGTGKVSVFVLDPQGEDATDSDLGCNSKKRIDDTLAGDYKIQVTPCLKYDNPAGPFKLTVSVTG